MPGCSDATMRDAFVSVSMSSEQLSSAASIVHIALRRSSNSPSPAAVALSRNVSAKRAFDMLVTGRFVDAATAAAWGLVNEAVPEDALDAAVARKVAEIVKKSPAAVRYGKQMFYRQRELPLDDAYAFAGDVMARNMMEEDAGEGIDAFLEKREPVWRS